MAGPSIEEFIQELKHDAAGDPSLQEQMEGWKKDTRNEIAEGRGGQVVSGSGNGTSFAVSLGITNFQWYAILGRILREIKSGQQRPSVTIARVL